MIVTPKDWHEFQHYNKRSPPWIKLHRTILDNYEFQILPDASKALAMCLWLIASEGKDGEIDANPEKLSFRLRSSAKKIEESLKPLIDGKFFLILQDDSDLLAGCYQDAPLEERRDRGETETERKQKQTTVQQFMENCDAKKEPYISEDDSIYKWAESVHIPDEFMCLTWKAFVKKVKDKKQLDWRKTYRNYVELNYLQLWAVDKSGSYYLTTLGQMIAAELGVNG